MLRRLKFIVGICIFSVILASFVEGQGMSGSEAGDTSPPDLVMSSTATEGIVGAFLRYLRPFTMVFLQFLNSALIRTKGEQLPCTIYNLAKMEYTCTPVVINATSS